MRGVEQRNRSHVPTVAVSVLGVLLLTLAASGALRDAERDADQTRLDGVTASFASVMRTELQRLSDAGTDVGVAASLVDDLDPAGYEELMRLLVVEERFPGVFGIALIRWVEREHLELFVADRQRHEPTFRVTNDGGEDLLRLVTFHHPLPENAPALGMDLSPRGETRVAADRAVMTGRPVLSGATSIAQLDVTEPGAVIHAPLPRREDSPLSTVAMVLSGQRFVEGLEPPPADVALEVSDPTSRSFSLLASIGDHDAATGLTGEAQVHVAGSTWQLTSTAERGFTVPWYQRASSALAFGGLLAAVLMGLFVRSLATREQMAMDLVDLRTVELSALNERLEDSNLALAASGRTKDAFLASVSHELRTPLTVIAGFVEAMRRLPADGVSPQSFVEPIERNVRRLDALVSDLLTVTSLDAKAVTAFRKPIDLQRVLPDLPSVLAGVEDEVVVTVEEGCRVEADPRHLDRILVNLLVNAERHGATPIEVSAASAPHGRVEIRVRDHGHGIPPEEVDRLFERFARGDDRGNVPGTGLGLSIVRELAELNGGEVRYEAGTPGACFVLSLERAP